MYFDTLDFFSILIHKKIHDWFSWSLVFGNPEDYTCVLADLVNPSALDRVFSQLEKIAFFDRRSFIK